MKQFSVTRRHKRAEQRAWILSREKGLSVFVILNILRILFLAMTGIAPILVMIRLLAHTPPIDEIDWVLLSAQLIFAAVVGLGMRVIALAIETVMRALNGLPGLEPKFEEIILDDIGIIYSFSSHDLKPNSRVQIMFSWAQLNSIESNSETRQIEINGVAIYYADVDANTKTPRCEARHIWNAHLKLFDAFGPELLPAMQEMWQQAKKKNEYADVQSIYKQHHIS